MDFYRYHGLGNDYLVMDPNQTSIAMTPDTVRAICKRHFGEGSDGILYGPFMDDRGEIHVRIFNPDGSEAEKSGNGTRIFARYLVDQGYCHEEDPFVFHTLGGLVRAHVMDRKSKIIMEMGTATFNSKQIPVSGEKRDVVNERFVVQDQAWNVTCVSMGNPHCVIPVETVSKELAIEWGPHVETHPMFPNRTNVQFLQVIDSHHIQIEIWERGAGYTLASGSSSCAAVAAAYRLGLTESTVKVHMPGGDLEIVVMDNYEMQMTGPVVYVACGYLSDELYSMD